MREEAPGSTPDADASPETPRALILGAGLAGLRGGLHLLEQGYDVEIFEKLERPGGMARSHRQGGFTFDHGPHGFFAREDWLDEEFKQLVDEEGGYLSLTKWSQIHYRDEYFNYPLKVMDLVAKMSPFTLLNAFFSYLKARVRLLFRPREPANVEEHLIDQFGRALYDEFFGPYTRKVWAVELTELDADFTRDRVPTLHLWDVIRKLFVDPLKEQRRARLSPSGRVAAHDLHSFYYPRRGADALPDAYARRVRDSGGRIRLGVDLTRIDLEARSVHGVVGGQPFSRSYDVLVSTIPPESLVALLDPAPPAEIASLSSSLRYRGILLVNLCVAKPQVIQPFWIYFTNRFFNRISEYRQFSTDLAPEGKTGICLEIGCNEDDELWSAPDAEIVKLCLPDLENLGLLKAEDIEDHLIIREKYAYPVQDVGYKDRVNRLVDWFEREAGIMVGGRQGRFLYINQDAAIKSGIEAAKAADMLYRTGKTEKREVYADDTPRRKIVT